jgi:hypothetical protein
MKNMICVLMVISFSCTYGQNVFFKGGMGFYELYENSILKGRDIELSVNLTPLIAVGLIWKISDKFELGCENVLRSKKFRADYYGIDTTNNIRGIYGYEDIQFLNLDVKAIGRLKVFGASDFELGIAFGGGITIKVNSTYDFNYVDPKILLVRDDSIPPEIPTFTNNSGVLAEIGIDFRYKNFSFDIFQTMEFYRAYLYGIGDNKAFITQFRIGYNI